MTAASQRRPAGVKLVDVAAAAGVSLATASRALSAPALLRPGTLKKVQEAAASLGYVPHGAARALASQRTRTIGAVFPPVDNPIFATGTRALARELAGAGYTLLLALHDYNEQEELAAVRRLIERGVDGLVLVGMRHDPELFTLLDNAGLPFELTWSLDSSEHHYSVGVAHRDAAAEITNHLIGLGHREFAVITGEHDNNDRAHDRMLGVTDALTRAGIALDARRVVPAAFAIASGRSALCTLLEQAPGFSAVVCANDVLAIGAIQECTTRSINVPLDMSVVGFDDIDMAAALTPGLTTVRVPSADIGSTAARRLLMRLAGETVERCRRMPTEIVFRETTAPPAKPSIAVG